MQARVPIILGVSLVLVSLSRADEAPAPPSLEHQVKIAFLYNFAKFIDWPGKVFADAASPMDLGILGNDTFCREAEATLQGRVVNGRRLVVRRLRPGDPMTGIEILFVSPAQPDVRRTLAGLSGSPILTVGDAQDFTRMGGIISFRVEENKVRFEINLTAAERAGLKISSRLLGVARVIQDKEPREGGR